jgi:2-dehydro-3-deoxyphosphogluconate aldolase/(4S)-4-hydroxy-2-oxoglutarate aldolase
MENWKKIIMGTGIIPVVKLDHLEDTLPLVSILAKEGIKLIEVTFRTDIAAQAIDLIRKNFPDVLVGAGTVLTLDQLEQAHKSQAQFIVAPGLNPLIVRAAQKLNLPIIPGVSSASEIEQAIQFNLDVVKFFPAVPLGGVANIKALSGPYPNISFIPTGGINLDNMNDFLKLPNVLAIGGSWMVDPLDLQAKKLDLIQEKTHQAVASLVGLTFDHIGFQPSDFITTVKDIEQLLDLEAVHHAKSSFISEKIEVINVRNQKVQPYHLAYKVNNIQRTMHYLNERGYVFDEETRVINASGQLKAIYLEKNFGGLSIHLIQR